MKTKKCTQCAEKLTNENTKNDNPEDWCDPCWKVITAPHEYVPPWMKKHV